MWPRFTFEPVSVSEEGVYILKVDKLEPAYKYRLSITMINWNSKEYKSEYYPSDTPAIDSISVESPSEKPVYICVTTHDNELEPTYYKWSYREIWEFNADLFANAGYLNDKFYMFERHTRSQNTYYCWGRIAQKLCYWATTDKLTENLIYEKELIEIPETMISWKSFIIEVQQNRIRKEAYEYFKNIQKKYRVNRKHLFPIPTEVRGNIVCVSDPKNGY